MQHDLKGEKMNTDRITSDIIDRSEFLENLSEEELDSGLVSS